MDMTHYKIPSNIQIAVQISNAEQAYLVIYSTKHKTKYVPFNLIVWC